MQHLVIVAALVAVAAAAPQWPQGGYVKKVTTISSSSSPLMSLEEHRGARMEQQLAMRKAVLAKEGGAEILEQDFDMPEPGHYQYRFKTNNGIERMEQAAMEAGQVRGAYVWTSPEGVEYKMEYVADDQGFHPMASFLPQAPEVPEAIKRSLEWNAAHPEEDSEMVVKQAPMAQWAAVKQAPMAQWAAVNTKSALF